MAPGEGMSFNCAEASIEEILGHYAEVVATGGEEAARLAFVALAGHFDDARKKQEASDEFAEACLGEADDARLALKSAGRKLGTYEAQAERDKGEIGRLRLQLATEREAKARIENDLREANAAVKWHQRQWARFFKVAVLDDGSEEGVQILAEIPKPSHVVVHEVMREGISGAPTSFVTVMAKGRRAEEVQAIWNSTAEISRAKENGRGKT